MLWLKAHYKHILGIMLSLSLGLFAGAALFRTPASESVPEDAPIEIANNDKPVGHIGKTSILPETEVNIRYHFLLCGHTLEQIEYDGVFTGCTEEELAKRLDGGKIAEFSPARTVIDIDLERYCPEHFVLFLNGEDKLCISHTDAGDYEMENIQALTYDIESLPEEVLSILEAGLVFSSLEEINAYLEDAES